MANQLQVTGSGCAWSSLTEFTSALSSCGCIHCTRSKKCVTWVWCQQFSFLFLPISHVLFRNVRMAPSGHAAVCFSKVYNLYFECRWKLSVCHYSSLTREKTNKSHMRSVGRAHTRKQGNKITFVYWNGFGYVFANMCTLACQRTTFILVKTAR